MATSGYWNPPVFLPGGSNGQRSLAGYSPWGHKESEATKATQHACMRGQMDGEIPTDLPVFQKEGSRLKGKSHI